MQRLDPSSPEMARLKAEALDALRHQEFVNTAKARADRRVAEACRRWSGAHGLRVFLDPNGLRREVSAA